MTRRVRLGAIRPVVAALVIAATLLAVAGASTWLVARRLAALAPGGATFARLHYDPFTTRLVLQDLRVRDAEGREVFQAQLVTARLHPVQLLLAAPRLAEARVVEPRLTVAAGHGLAALGARLAAAPAAAMLGRVDDLLVTGGRVIVLDGAGRSVPLVRDLEVRLGRSTTAGARGRGVVFAAAMAAYGTTVHVTGQPRGTDYLVQAHARDLDTVALARDLPVRALHGLHRARSDLDAELRWTGPRVLATGTVHLTDVVWPVPGAGRAIFRAAGVTAVVEGLDLASGAGRLVRLQLDTPVLRLPSATAGATLAALAAPWRRQRALLVRRVVVAGGTLALEGRGGVRLERVRFTATAPERDGDWTLSAWAGMGPNAEIALEGLLTADLSRLDATARMQHVALGPWRMLLGDTAQPDTRVSFDGRLRAALHDGEAAVLLAGPVVTTRLGVEEVVPYEATPAGVPLRVLLASIDDPLRVIPAAPPRSTD